MPQFKDSYHQLGVFCMMTEEQLFLIGQCCGVGTKRRSLAPVEFRFTMREHQPQSREEFRLLFVGNKSHHERVILS